MSDIWTTQEEENLREAFETGDSRLELARKFGRSKSAIDNKLSRLGLICVGDSGGAQRRDERRIASSTQRLADAINAALESRQLAIRPARKEELSPFERQMRALERGARLVANDRAYFGFPGVYRGDAA